MKTQTGLKQKMLLATLLAFLLSSGVACSPKKDGFSADNADATAATGGTTTTVSRDEVNYSSDWTSGAIGKIDSLDRAALNTYASTHPINNPKNAQISVRLAKAGDVAGNGGYAGVVQIGYEDNGQYYVGRFTANDTYNASGSTGDAGTRYKNWHHAAYNKWFTWNGKRLFHGFFEDEYGAVLLIVEQNLDQGDGAGSSQVTGSIWFKNYYNSPYARPQTKDVLPCWFITEGPYDCRTFLMKDGVNVNKMLGGDDGNILTTSALLPTESKYAPGAETHPYHQGADAGVARGWRKLGTFSGLNAAQAFDN